jgi:hypothetical protein
MNEETKKVLSEAEHLKGLVKSDGWKIVKRRLLEKMSDYGSILNFDEQDPAKLFQLVGANQQAIKLVISWFGDIENSINLAAEYKESIKDELNKMVITSNED